MQRMSKRSVLIALMACAAAQAGGAHAQSNAMPAPKPPAVDPDVTAALDKMGAYLRTLTTFRVSALMTREQVLEDGEKVQYGGTVELLAQRPNKLFVTIKSDRDQRQFYYDGKQFTLYAPRDKFYATVPAPGTINDLINQLEDKYDIELPLIDLFRWGTSEADFNAISRAQDLGQANVQGTTCEHFALRQEGADWQIWLQPGQYALPCRVVITTTTDEARPQMEATYTWNMAPAFNDEAFVFTPPQDAKLIKLEEVKPMPGVQKKQENKK